jgi:CheY-like chemotaxis protein
MDHRHFHILYIEDQPEAVEMVRLALRVLGCEVRGAPDGSCGLQMMRSLQPDLVLLDLMLPGLDGWQVRDAMRRDPQLRDVPVVVVTAETRLLDGDESVLPPADAYIIKPFSIAELRATVGSMLARLPQTVPGC